MRDVKLEPARKLGGGVTNEPSFGQNTGRGIKAR